MKTMPATKVKAFNPLQLVRRIVAEHRKNSPYPNIAMAIWMNPTNDPLYALMNGIELVEIRESAFFDPEPEFKAVRVAPSWERPGLIFTLTSLGELSLDLEKNGKRSYYNKLQLKLDRGLARVIYPNSAREGSAILEKLMTTMDVGA